MGKKPHSERRQFGRRETSLHAVILLPGRGSVHCTVTNLSEQGALITLVEPMVLPPVFRLKIEALGIERNCNRRHQGENGIGVLFVDHITAEKMAAKAEGSARRHHGRPSNAPADAGVRLREELQVASHASKPPDDMRTLSQVPGRVIRGV